MHVFEIRVSKYSWLGPSQDSKLGRRTFTCHPDSRRILNFVQLWEGVSEDGVPSQENELAILHASPGSLSSTRGKKASEKGLQPENAADGCLPALKNLVVLYSSYHVLGLDRNVGMKKTAWRTQCSS